MADPETIHALHRYFLQANAMRTHYDDLVRKHGAARVGDDNWTEQYLYLSLWYGCLFVVVDGWKELGLHDPEIDALLTDCDGPEMTELLRRFRNGVFHFQEDYWDARFVDFLAKAADSAVWTRSLNRAFGRWLLTWSRGQRGA